jgi:hypothetical protein
MSKNTPGLPPPPAPSLHERITALKADIDAYIDALVEKDYEGLKNSSAPIPREVLRQMLTVQGGGCHCAQYQLNAPK